MIVVWRVTERCDTACGFCAYDRTLRRPRRELDPAEALRFGGVLARSGRDVLVAWLGGEPFLWTPLVSVSTALRARGLRIGITTNGRALAAEETRRFVLDTVDELTVSIDGPPDVHDVLRRRPGAALALHQALADLSARRTRPLLLRVNTVVMRDNVARFEELVDQVTAMGCDELTFNALGGNDRPEFHADHHLDEAGVATLAAALDRVRARGRLRVRGGDGYLARLRASAARRPVPVDDCGPGRAFLFIEVDGTVSACSFTPGVPLASVHDLDALPARLAARLPARACGDCPSTQVHEKFA